MLVSDCTGLWKIMPPPPDTSVFDQTFSEWAMPMVTWNSYADMASGRARASGSICLSSGIGLFAATAASVELLAGLEAFGADDSLQLLAAFLGHMGIHAQ